MAAKIAVLGAGAWGLTLAGLWVRGSEKFRKEPLEVFVYCRDQVKAGRLRQTRVMDKPRGFAIAPTIVVEDNLRACIDGASVIVFACTSQSLRSLAQEVALLLSAEGSPSAALVSIGHGLDGQLPALVSAVKGLELGTLMRMSEVLAEVLPGRPIAALTGPNLSEEILNGMPAASVIASSNFELARALQELLSVSRFRVYANDDVIGCELGGTLKNIIAIAAGSCDGLGLGVNAKAALLTRGLAEMTRLAVRLGAKPTTLAGLAGMGDLFATCASPLSRNYRVGFELVRGKTLDQILTGLGAVAEGVTTAAAVCELSQRLGLELPIAEQVESTLKGNSTPAGAIMALLSRPLASE
ncbi:MAG: NAD(P)-dependent glycerol-3-phosphate dehydrogenase [Cyanobacteria bacterium SZAS TMP-1]|nr:NAD(P)-dependent glycerol-3-phosphate dehydrogenase [Cyanobacteria bacterium SZAS TMP-1]